MREYKHGRQAREPPTSSIQRRRMRAYNSYHEVHPYDQ